MFKWVDKRTFIAKYKYGLMQKLKSYKSNHIIGIKIQLFQNPIHGL